MSFKKGTEGLSLEAGKWMSLGMIIQRAVSFFTFIILARLLLPSDFGVMPLLIIIPVTLDVLTNFNFDSTIINKKYNPEEHLRAIWTFSLLKSCLIAFLTFLFSPLILNFFHLPSEYLNILRLSGLLVIIPNLGNVGQIYFFKELNFKMIFIRDMVSTFTYTVSTISLAFVFHSYLAIFWGTALQNIAGVIVTYVLHPYRPKITKDLSGLRSLFGFSKWIYGQNLLGQIGALVENSLIGRFTSTHDLGLYTKAKGLALAPISPLSSLIRKIGFSAYSNIQNEQTKIIDGATKMLDILLLISIPFIGTILLGGHQIVLILLGENWLGMIGVLKLLVVAMVINTFSITATDPLLNGIGLPHIQFRIRLVSTATFIGAILFLIPQYGISGAAYSILISSLITSFYIFFQLKKFLFKVDLRKPIYSSLIVLVSTSAIFTLGEILIEKPIFNQQLGFVGLIILLGILYTGLIFIADKLFKHGPWKTILLLTYALKKT